MQHNCYGPRLPRPIVSMRPAHGNVDASSKTACTEQLHNLQGRDGSQALGLGCASAVPASVAALQKMPPQDMCKKEAPQAVTSLQNRQRSRKCLVAPDYFLQQHLGVTVSQTRLETPQVEAGLLDPGEEHKHIVPEPIGAAVAGSCDTFSMHVDGAWQHSRQIAYLGSGGAPIHTCSIACKLRLSLPAKSSRLRFVRKLKLLLCQLPSGG